MVHAQTDQHPPFGGPMTVEQFHQLEQAWPSVRYEYINGSARLMVGGSREHDRMSRHIVDALERQLGFGSCQAYGVDVQVLIGVKTSGKRHYVYPDATVSCSEADHREGNLLIEMPRLVVEVLSPGNEKEDRREKLKLYQKCKSIVEIIFFDQYKQIAEAYRRNGEDGDTWMYQLYDEEDQQIDVLCLSLSLSWDDIYRGVPFFERKQQN